MKSLMKPLADTLNTAFEKVKTDLHQALLGGLASLFEAHPNVKSVQFTAYRPFFNDGEECTYSCHAGDCTFNGYEEYADSEIEAEGEDILSQSLTEIWANGKYKENPEYNKESATAVESFRDALGEISNELWEVIVGDHVSVNITPNGITTSPYDHE